MEDKIVPYKTGPFLSTAAAAGSLEDSGSVSTRKSVRLLIKDTATISTLSFGCNKTFEKLTIEDKSYLLSCLEEKYEADRAAMKAAKDTNSAAKTAAFKSAAVEIDV